jgi:hypothetical protein
MRLQTRCVSSAAIAAHAAQSLALQQLVGAHVVPGADLGAEHGYRIVAKHRSNDSSHAHWIALSVG